MHTIDVDFEVFKQLTIRRATESVTYNDVIRDLLGLGQSKPVISLEATRSGSWVSKGVKFPEGTEFRAKHKGQLHTGRVVGGGLSVNGKSFDTPSSAAMSITGNPVNGWRFWECRLPNMATWVVISSLRK